MTRFTSHGNHLGSILAVTVTQSLELKYVPRRKPPCPEAAACGYEGKKAFARLKYRMKGCVLNYIAIPDTSLLVTVN